MELRADSGRPGSAVEDEALVESHRTWEESALYNIPRKLSKILAAFSASPGRLNP
jgi:hypothetical protein